MKQLIHDAPGFQLTASITHHPICGPTLQLHTVWPTANHPEPHRLLSLTLPPESFVWLAALIGSEIQAQ